MYYEVAVRSKTFYGREGLTYESPGSLPLGTIVQVPFGKKQAHGVVLNTSEKPSFATKMITSTTGLVLPARSLELLSWLAEYYPAPLGAVASQFIPTLSDTFFYEPSEQLPKPHTIPNLPPLTADQTEALTAIRAHDTGTMILHGETGSGKTRVYMELALEARKNGKSSLILVPEIGLTKQISNTFGQVFGQDLVVVIHSNQTPKERREAWLKSYHLSKVGMPHIVIGPRSALFAPLQDIGLVVVDEAHDPAYKQEQLPHYQAARVASQLARLHGSRLILGSATPGTVDYYLAQQKGAPIISMRGLATGQEHDLTRTLVDLRDKPSFSANRFMSNQLLEAIQKRLDKHEQSLIFLNRRGSARLVSCQDCGWHAACPNCDIPLVYHSDQGQIRCHTCGYANKMPTSCPQCGSVEILFKSIGTKAVVEFLERRFPKARVARFDLDNAAGDKIEHAYEGILRGEVDIIVGTQLITKGLDLPRLSLVGVLLADAGLSMPDFTANERTFQLLYQVVGRVGRGHSKDNEAIVQSFDPDNWVLQTALHKKWHTFYEQDLREREKFGFPPFYHLLRVVNSAARKTTAEFRLAGLTTELQREVPGIKILGPSPCFVEKVANKYRMQLVIKAKSRSKLLEVINLLPSTCTYDLDPQNLL